MIDGFKAYASKIRDNGYLIIKKGLLNQFTIHELMALANRGIRIYEFGEGDVQIQIDNIRIQNGRYVFDYTGLGHAIKDVVMSMPGKHNVENACVAISVGLLNGVTHEK